MKDYPPEPIEIDGVIWTRFTTERPIGVYGTRTNAELALEHEKERIKIEGLDPWDADWSNEVIL